jgi:hypothetical protein
MGFERGSTLNIQVDRSASRAGTTNCTVEFGTHMAYDHWRRICE